jgi:hypothetical protein
MKRRLLVLFAASLAFCCVGERSSAQERNAWQFPSELRPSLDARLMQFLTAQSDGRWDDVSTLLGDYRFGYFGGSLRFTKFHKTCLISAMKKFPMIHFDYAIRESPYSSEFLTNPAGRKEWPLEGDGTFQTGNKVVKQKTWLAAYRAGGDWFFSPPVDAAGSQLSREELLRDRKGEIDLPSRPDSPLEVIDLHVFIDPKDTRSRDIRFRLRNKTDKVVARYGYKISDAHKQGSISFGTGAQRDAIEPNGTSHEFHESYASSLYRCEGEARIQVEIDNVGFADGTEWNAPESKGPEQTEE